MDGAFVKISRIAYDTKPSGEDMKTITFDMMDSNSFKIDYSTLADIIESGHSILLGKYKDGCKSTLEPNIEYLECIALDIDSKENPITLFEMQSLIFKKFGALPILAYPTFSDLDYTRFRLIYRFEDKVDVEIYRLFYKALIWKFKKYLDGATCNANRIWAGTNKKVIYNDSDIPFSTSLVLKLIYNHSQALKRKEKKVEFKKKEEFIKYENEDYIKPEFKKEVLEKITKGIDILDFIARHFGGTYKLKGNKYFGSCPLPHHGGDRNNKEAFVIFKDTNTYRCFTHCGSGNILSLARLVYGTSNFSRLVFALANEYNIEIDEGYIRRVKNEQCNKYGEDKE